MLSFLKQVYHYLISCSFRGHVASSHHVDILFGKYDPYEVYTICCRCQCPIIIYKLDNDNYAIIEDV